MWSTRRALSPTSRLCRGAPLHLGPEPEEGPLGPAAAGKAKPKSPTTNSSRGSSSALNFLAETTRRAAVPETVILATPSPCPMLEKKTLIKPVS
ncbi:spexin isoform X1 [Canis lupus baileyi]|uniref:spexin isoform X1 n=1 Tax=Canis lupus baileyi TaxID=143281 RepID=UPI003B97B175